MSEVDPFFGVCVGTPADDALYIRVSRFLAHEARLLDEEKYADWLALFADDTRYWMPAIENRYRKDKKGAYGLGRTAFFDDSLDDLKLRNRRLESGVAWPEDPPTRHVYAISNIEVFHTDAPDAIFVHSVFTSYRNKLDRDQSMLIGRREDVLRLRGDSMSIARRKIVISQALLAAKNLNIFF